MPTTAPTGAGHMARRTRAQQDQKTDDKGRAQRAALQGPGRPAGPRKTRQGVQTRWGQRNRALLDAKVCQIRDPKQARELLDKAAAIAPLTAHERRVFGGSLAEATKEQRAPEAHQCSWGHSTLTVPSPSKSQRVTTNPEIT